MTAAPSPPDANRPGAATPPRYAAFVSYNHRDRRIAAWLHRGLEAYRFPKHLRGRPAPWGTLGAKLPPIFQDREELSASGSLAASVQEAMRASHALVVVCTPDGARSKWVNEEVRAFTALGRRDRLQCLIAAGEPNASRMAGGDPELECLPPALFEDGGEEPMAADIRPGMDGRAAALLKLIAGITGLGYDELRQREAQRRAKRLKLVASASAVLTLVMAGLAVFAFLSRDEAVRQRDLARQKTLTAERTVDFVKSLFAVSAPSEARGRTITAREVLDRGARQIETGLVGEPGVRAELATTLGEVYAGLGLYREGDRLVRGALRLPGVDTATRARQLAALGDGLTLQGDYRGAIAAYGRGLSLAQGSGRPELVTRVLVGLGEALSSAGDDAGGDRAIRRALALDMARLGPDHPDVARDREALGFNHFFGARYAAARPEVERGLAIRLAKQGRFHPRVSQDLNTLGAIAYHQRDLAASTRFYRQALAISGQVLGPEHPDVALTANALARNMIERRDFAPAEPLLRRAVAITVRERGALNDDMAFLFTNRGIVERARADAAAAEADFRRGLAAAEFHKHRNRAPILLELAELACTRGGGREGLALVDRAAPVMREDYPGDPWRTAWVDVVRAQCLAASGDAPRARRLLAAATPTVIARWPPDSLYGARLTAIRALAR